MFVLQTTNKSKPQNVGGNYDRKEVKVMPQIILYEWKIIFSESLLHKTPTPWYVFARILQFAVASFVFLLIVKPLAGASSIM